MPGSDETRLRAEITAALIWDLPALRAGSKSAQDFAKALEGELDKWWEPRSYGLDPLGRAAQAVAAERAGDPAQGLPVYKDLATADDDWVGLLGRMLMAWSETGDDSDGVAQAQQAAEGIAAPDELRARLHAKTATFALDTGQHDLARESLARAVELAPQGTRLYSRLAFEAANAGLGRPDAAAFPDEGKPFGPDPLVDYPWIVYAALDAAQAGMNDEVERNAERLWSWKLRFGGTTPLDQVVSAEVQATWAGALWLRRPLRLQLGAQLLNGEATHAQQWGYGILMWVLGNGKSPEGVYRLAEPHLDQESVDYVIRQLREADWPRGLSHRFVRVASEAWDDMSGGTLRWLVDFLEPDASEHPTVREVNRLWAGYAARFPQEWLERVQAQSPETQVALLSMVGLPTIQRLPLDAKGSFGRLLLDNLSLRERPNEHLLRLAVELVPRNLRPRLATLIAEHATPEALAEIADSAEPDIAPAPVLERARDQLVETLARESAEAREGKVSFGPHDTRLALARLLVTLPPDPEAVATLAAIGSDPDLPGEHIVAARNGLALLRHKGKLTESEIAWWHDVPDPPGTLPEHGGISDELAQIRRLQILARELTAGEGALTVMATRSRDRRVRVLAIEVCSEAAKAEARTEQRAAFVWALVGGLWDPQDYVAASAVWALAAEMAQGSAAAEVALNRLPRLYGIGNTRVRTAVAETAARLGRTAPAQVQAVLQTAATDKSWQVRQAAADPRRL